MLGAVLARGQITPQKWLFSFRIRWDYDGGSEQKVEMKQPIAPTLIRCIRAYLSSLRPPDWSPLSTLRGPWGGADSQARTTQIACSLRNTPP